MIFALRHGERGDRSRDYEKSIVELEHDPHLTELGSLQAQHAGKVIKRVSEETIGTDMNQTSVKYMVVSSPFLRCIMTAHGVIKSLGEENIFGGKLFLDNSITETYRAVYFEEEPTEHVFVRSKKDEITKYMDFPFQDGLIAEGQHIGKPEFPEEHKKPEVRQKRKDFYEKIVEHYTTSIKDAGNVVLVIVSHWYIMELILEHHDTEDDDPQVCYTSLTHIQLGKDEEDKKVVFKLYEDHFDWAVQEYTEKKELTDQKFKKY